MNENLLKVIKLSSLSEHFSTRKRKRVSPPLDELGEDFESIVQNSDLNKAVEGIKTGNREALSEFTTLSESHRERGARSSKGIVPKGSDVFRRYQKLKNAGKIVNRPIVNSYKPTTKKGYTL